MHRRRFLGGVGAFALGTGGALVAGPSFGQAAGALPGRVAGVPIPDSEICRSAAAFAAIAQPQTITNHCLRTYVFAALLGDAQQLKFDHESLFIAAAMHDLGLTPKYATPGQPFEMDSADTAKAFLVKHGVSEDRAETIWRAIAMHTSALSDHFGPDVSLLGDGAGADVFGGGLASLPHDKVAEVVAAFPRLRFKAAFEQTLLDYCHQKPRPQAATWTGGFCRVHAPSDAYPDLAARLQAAPFAE